MKIIKINLVIEYGDILNRHLTDGDYVLFNRQPSLHKMSMMGHRVKVMKGNTFRLNVSGVTSPYNADFDGDEMNMYVPQSCGATSELINIANKIARSSPRENKPIISLVQDPLLGIYKLTHTNVINPEKSLTYYNKSTIYDLDNTASYITNVPSGMYTRKI